MAWSPERQMDRNMEFFSPEAIMAREGTRHAQKRELEGTYAQRADDERKLKGTFDQNAKLRRQIEGTYDQRAINEMARHGTFDQNAKLRRELEGTYGQRVVDETNMEAMRGDMMMDRLAYQYGKPGVEGQKVGLLGEELDIRRRAEMGNLLAKVREDSVKLFPDNPEKAAEYYSQESKKVTSMFPETMPNIPGLAEQLHGGPEAPGGPAAANGDKGAKAKSAGPELEPPPSRDINVMQKDPLVEKIEGAASVIKGRLFRGDSMFGARDMPVPAPQQAAAPAYPTSIRAPMPAPPAIGGVPVRKPIPNAMPGGPGPAVSAPMPPPGTPPPPRRPVGSAMVNPFVSTAFAGDGSASWGHNMQAPRNPLRRLRDIEFGEVYSDRNKSTTSPPGR